jgi:hypothetical protein
VDEIMGLVQQYVEARLAPFTSGPAAAQSSGSHCATPTVVSDLLDNERTAGEVAKLHALFTALDGDFDTLLRRIASLANVQAEATKAGNAAQRELEALTHRINKVEVLQRDLAAVQKRQVEDLDKFTHFGGRHG